MEKRKGIYGCFFKRALDIFLSGIALLVLWPFMLILAFFVRIYLGSPVIFRQERPGLHEKIFCLFKFRTMTDATDPETGKKLPDELRLTRFGRFLRATSLDELPELWNIFKGDMSLIGPRPLLVEYLPYYTEEERHRHDVRPGLTGLAQVNGRNCVEWGRRFQYDLEYIRNLSFWNDVKIVILTVAAVFQHKGIQVDTQKEEGNLAEIRQRSEREEQE